MARKSRKNQGQAVCAEPVEKRYIAGGYLRLSADDRRKKGDSIANQKSIIQQYLSAHPEIRLHDFYMDNAASGTSFDRPAFKRMLEDAENGRINCIIVKDLSRFGRNAIDAGYYIERHLPALGVRFIALGDDYDSNEGSGGIMLPLKNVVNEAYALDIGRKCRAVHRQNILEGKFVGRMAPYGYLKSPEDCHKLVVDPRNGPTVERIFAWAKEHASPYEIARRLNGEGLPPPSLDKKKRGIVVDDTPSGRYWNRRTILGILTDRVYVGDLVQGKTKTAGHRQVQAAPEEWITVENTHQPIISRELFAQVQEALAEMGREAMEKRNPTAPYTPALFAGKVFCGHCGYAMHRKRQNSDGIYWYRCETQFKYAKSACVQVSVKEEALREGAAAMLRKYAEALLGRNLRLCKQAVESTDEQARRAELARINRESGRSRDALKSLIERKIRGEITGEQLAALKQEHERKMTALAARALELEASARQIDSVVRDCRELAACLTSVRCKYDLTVELLDKYVEKILVWHDKSFEVVWRFQRPFDESEEAEQWAM